MYSKCFLTQLKAVISRMSKLFCSVRDDHMAPLALCVFHGKIESEVHSERGADNDYSMERIVEFKRRTIISVDLTQAASTSIQNFQDTERQVLRDNEFLFVVNGLNSNPTCEIISLHPRRGMSLEPNLINVNSFGVNFVMRHFFSGMLAAEFREATVRDAEDLDLICNEERLDPNANRAEG